MALVSRVSWASLSTLTTESQWPLKDPTQALLCTCIFTVMVNKQQAKLWE